MGDLILHKEVVNKMTDDKDLVNKTIEMLLPKVQETVQAIVEGNLSEKLPTLKTAMQNELWDKAVEEIATRLNLPADVITKLQGLDDLVNANKEGIAKTIEDLIAKVEGFKDRLKGIDLAKTVTMSYAELQKEKVKASVWWSIAFFFVGFCSGVMWLIYYLKLI